MQNGFRLCPLTLMLNLVNLDNQPKNSRDADKGEPNVAAGWQTDVIEDNGRSIGRIGPGNEPHGETLMKNDIQFRASNRGIPKLCSRSALFLSMLLLGVASTPSIAQQPFPSHPIKLVIPYAAGGPLDPIFRAITGKMADKLKQPIVVENRPGGGGTLGLDYVAGSAPDGYTMAAVASTGIYFYHFRNRSDFDFKKTFSSLGQVYETTLLIMSNPDAAGMKDIKTIQQLIAYSKTVPQLPITGSGYGSTAHLMMAELKEHSGAHFVYVPYKGLASALPDVLSGLVPVYVGTMTQLPLVKAGKLRALASVSEHRDPALPDVPTLAESGYADVVGRAEVGMAVPAGTPQPVIAVLSTEFKAAMNDPAIVKTLETAGGVHANYQSPERFADAIAHDFEYWGQIIRKNNFKAE